MRRPARLVLLFVLLGAAALVWLSPLRAHLTREEIRAAVESVRAAWYAPLLLIGIYALGCVFAVPASLFIIAAGAIWGWLLGGTFAMAGGMLGAMASFQVARMLGSGSVQRAGRSQRLTSALRDASFRSLLVARLLPIFPFAALNYGAGIVRVNRTAFFFSTLLGLIPSNYVFAWSADEIFNGTLSGGGILLRLFAVAAVSTVAVAVPSLAARAIERRAARV
jgi:uncharacterized membrane protein YdjX (TVP38/TMEM64 family)